MRGNSKGESDGVASPHSLARIAILIVLTMLLSLQLPIGPQRAAATQPVNSFTFSVSGDFGPPNSADSLASLQRLAASNPNSFLGLGDFSSSDSYPGGAWCSQFKNSFNNVEIVAGDRDTGGHNDTVFQESNNYDQYLAGCPHSQASPISCGPVAGQCYGKEYYFDYPSTSPLARIIFVSPKIYNLTGVCTASQAGTQCSSQTGQQCTDQFGCWQYYTNDIHYNWVAQAIDQGRTMGIKWVIVAMHKNCISAGVNTCSMGIEFFNLLISKKVDLIVQAHEESYQRSKQIALNGSCTSITTNGAGWATYNPNCVVDDGSTGLYAHGKGTVIVIQGDWGRGWDPVNSTLSNGPNAAEAPYFTTLMGQNTPGRGHGFVTYNVFPDRIDVQTNFAGSYQDSFSISYTPYRSHSNILIASNSQFNATNGVSQGDGTLSSPYLIQGWEIESGSTAINIANTTAYFVIKTVYLLGLSTGISLLNVTNGLIESSTLVYDDVGIILSNSSSNVIDNNTISGGREGITLIANSNHNTCRNNEVSGSSIRGITISQQSANNLLSQNLLTNQSIAFSIISAENTAIAVNRIAYSSLGIYAEGSQNATIFGNTIANNLDGIVANQSTLKVFHNNFISNALSPPVRIQMPTATTQWNDSYPNGGNFWSDYTGTDNCSGPDQNICPNADDIGDQSYKIDDMDQDKLPLVKPYGPQPSHAPSWPDSKALAATNVNRDNLTLTWTKAIDINGVANYLVYEDGVLIATLTDTVLPVTGLKLGATYDFTVQASDAWLNSSIDGPKATVRVLAKGAYLTVKSLSSGTVYQGGTIELDTQLTNLGQDDDRITSLVVSGDIGAFPALNIRESLPSGTIGTYNASVHVPSDATVGNHTISVTVTWQYFDQATSSWATATSLSASTWLEVKSSGHPPPQSTSNPTPATPLDLFLLMSHRYVLAGLSGLVVLAIGLLFSKRRKRSKNGPGVRFLPRLVFAKISIGSSRFLTVRANWPVVRDP